eukprot:g53018.t1
MTQPAPEVSAAPAPADRLSSFLARHSDDCDILSRLYPQPSDGGAAFDAGPHTYQLRAPDGGWVLLPDSVTGVVHCFFPAFESKRVAAEVAARRGVAADELELEWQRLGAEACETRSALSELAELALRLDAQHFQLPRGHGSLLRCTYRRGDEEIVSVTCSQLHEYKKARRRTTEAPLTKIGVAGLSFLTGGAVKVLS